jgi:hypothetical protein
MWSNFGHFDELFNDDLKSSPHLLTARDDLVGRQNKSIPAKPNFALNIHEFLEIGARPWHETLFFLLFLKEIYILLNAI